LSDDELAWVWRAADALPYPTGPYVKLLILCGQRRAETAHIRASRINRTERLWTMPPASYKTKAHNEVPFGAAAWAVIEGLAPHVATLEKRCAERTGKPQSFDHLLVSATKCHGDVPIRNYSDVKEAVNAKIVELQAEAKEKGEKITPVESWSLHDLRHS